MAGRIFINYRRDDAAPWAGRIYERLTRDFRKRQLFIDIDNIPPGMDFVKVLDEQVAKCDVLLAIIGKNWLSAATDTGKRRIDDPDDFVRIEIESALKRDVRVIPVIVDGADMPSKDVLPESLQSLTRRQAWRLSHTGFGMESDGLCRALKQLPSRRPSLFARTKALRDSFDFSQYAGAIPDVSNLISEAQKAGHDIGASPFWPKLAKSALETLKLGMLFTLGMTAIVLGQQSAGSGPDTGLAAFIALCSAAAFIYLTRRWFWRKTETQAQQASAAPNRSDEKKQPTTLLKGIASAARILVLLACLLGVLISCAAIWDESQEPATMAFIGAVSAAGFVYFWRRWIKLNRRAQHAEPGVATPMAQPILPTEAVLPQKD